MRIHSFNPVASAYSSKVASRRYSQFLTLVHELNLSGTEQVLDIGSGPGELSFQIANNLNSGGFLHGIDLSETMVKLARRRAKSEGRDNLSFNSGDALNLSFKDNTFDVIVSSNAFPWVPDRAKFLREVFRVLKPGGRFGLVALSSTCYHEFSKAFKKSSQLRPELFGKGRPFELMGARLHTISELGRLVTKAGFEVKNRFSLSTEEPIAADDYITRVNAIVNENYLTELNEADQSTVRQLLHEQLAVRNGELKITESSIFVIAEK